MHAFNFEKAEKVDEKACFYTKEANLNVRNLCKKHFFPTEIVNQKSLILIFFLKQKMNQNLRIQFRKGRKIACFYTKEIDWNLQN